MKTSTKVFIIIASAMLVLGAAILAVTLAFYDFDLERFDTNANRESKSYISNEAVTSLVIDGTFDDIEILNSKDGGCKVDYYEGEKDGCEVSLIDGTLTIKQKNYRKWYDFINISFGTQVQGIKVYLPSGEYESIVLKSAGGDVDINGFRFLKADITTASGDIEISDIVSTDINIKTASGDINVTSLEAEKANIKSVSGDMEISSVIADLAELIITSGDCKIEKADVKEFKTQTTSGEFYADNLNTTQTADIKSTSGNIRLKNSDAGEFMLDAVSGDIFCEIKTSKYFETDTTSGDVSTPPSDINGGRFKVKTVSGDITVKYAK